MATQVEVAVGYDPIDRIHRAALGTFADVSGAFYDGDDSLTLEQAQSKKHDRVFHGLGLESGDTLLDIGCGWGPLLNAARERGIEAVGLTLSPAQERRCRKEGLDARLVDWRDAEEPALGTFSGVASLGAFEHFVSPAEMLAGRQEEVYRNFFRLCHSLLAEGGSLFLQTMTWGDRVPEPADLDVRAPHLSDRWVMGHLAYLYPGAWLPESLEQITACSSPWFELHWESNGRNDYIRTMHAWKDAVAALGARKYWAVAPLILGSLVDERRRRLFTALRYRCALLCFERGIFSHHRMILRPT